MDTTRNAETPPNFVPKTLQKWPGKVPNVASETLEKKDLLPVFVIPVLSRPVALTSAATARLMDTTRNAETPPNFVPKTLQKWPGKVPNVASESLEKKDLYPAFVITVLSRPVALTSAATARLMDTTRNAETPPNFVPKTLQKWPGKVPNVASESLEKKILPAFVITVLSRPVALASAATARPCVALTSAATARLMDTTVLSRPVALTSAATARLMDTTRNAETPPNFVPKTLQKWPGKVPNVASETQEKNLSSGCLWDNRPVASCRCKTFNLATLQLATPWVMDTTRNTETPT